MTSRDLVRAGLLVLAIQAAAVGAAAQDDARTLFVRGQTAYAQGDYEGAISFWSRAFELDPRPLLKFNLSQAYERLGRLEDAVAALQGYLDLADPTDEHQADARARIAGLRERINRTAVHVVGGPEGATILVDDQDRGRTPHPDPVQVSPGTHRLVVTAPGHEDFTSTLVVPAGQSVEVLLELRRLTDPSVEASSRSTEPDLVPAIVILSVGGAALIAGGILGGVALSQAGAARTRSSSEAESARALALGADITLGVGAVVEVVGIVVLAVALSTGGSETAPARAVQLTPILSDREVGLAIEGSF